MRRMLAALCLVALAAPGPARARGDATVQRSTFVPVLIYHHVKWLKPGDNAIERGLTILPDQFEAELRLLARSKYHTIDAAQLVAYLQSGRPLPTKPVALTFDDGYIDVFRTAYPELRRWHMTATFFIVPGFLDTPRYMSWSQVLDMARHGMDIEAHSMTHPDLTTVPAARLRLEVTVSRQELEQRLHRSVRVFAYPYGAYNAAVLRAVAAAGYRAAFTTRQGWWASRDQMLTLPRVYVDLDDTLSIFAGRLRADPPVLAEDPV